MDRIKQIREEVYTLLDNDDLGYSMNHVDRVLNLSLRIAEKENSNKEIVALIALLHDVDDCKLFGYENAEKLTNARKIMDSCNVSFDIQEEVLSALMYIGYSKSLKVKINVFLKLKFGPYH